MNVGATSPGAYGNYYAWGETEQKQHYDDDNCDTWEKEIGDIGGTSRDVAHIEWGGNWRMPTKAEFDELLDEDNCAWKWTTLDGHNGYKVTSKKTGNSIFLPAAGWRVGSSLDRTGVGGHYWSSTPYEGRTLFAVDLAFGSSFLGTGWRFRFGGCTVRPVIEL